jgi:hypothetical protein
MHRNIMYTFIYFNFLIFNFAPLNVLRLGECPTCPTLVTALHITGVDRRATKGITNATMESMATVVSKVIVTTM